MCVTSLIELWLARRTRLLNEEKQAAFEGDYARALERKGAAAALLMAVEDVHRIRQEEGYGARDHDCT